MTSVWKDGSHDNAISKVQIQTVNNQFLKGKRPNDARICSNRSPFLQKEVQERSGPPTL